MTRETPNRVSAEQWRRVEAALDELLDLDRDARPGALERVCGPDRALQAEVAAFLRAADAEPSFLSDSAAAMLGPVLAEPDPEAGLDPGERIGPWRIVRLLARGGMGAVYLAERSDGQFEQRVALKLIRPGLSSLEIHRRFRAERQILARLAHPNIARLVDGGVSSEGQPYFAMEFVDGERLTDYCDARRLEVGQRLRLFLQVLDAVRYAHQGLVVHRDLKPSNILVTRDGQAKLLDFGLAKLLQGGEAGDAETRTGFLLMTPEYAAPEQVRGEPVTTATDVYALGAVLYELLTGRRLHRFERHTPAEYERVVCDVLPEPPSQAVTRQADLLHPDGRRETITPVEVGLRRATQPGRLRRQLSGDLDTIVLKALQKEPERRYSSAEAFREDLQRYLAGLPVRARPDSLGYRARKFIRRHRWAVVSVVLVLGTLVGGLGATLWQARAANRAARRATVIKEFLVSLFQVATPEQSRGQQVTAQELLGRGARSLDTALAGQPSLRAELMGELGKIYRELGLYDEADSILARSVDLAGQADGPRSLSVAARLVDWGTVLREKGDYARADSLISAALVIRRGRLGPTAPDVALTMGELAATARMLGQTERAESLYQQTLALDRRNLGDNHLDVATDLANFSLFMSEEVGDLRAADSLARAALAIRIAQQGPENLIVLIEKGNLAAILADEGEYAEAERLQREVLEARRRWLPPGHPDLAYSYHGLARILAEQGRYAEAESSYAEALAIRQAALGPDNPRTLGTVNNLAIVRYRLGDLPGAEGAFRQALAGFLDTQGDSSQAYLAALNNLGTVLRDEGQVRRGGAAPPARRAACGNRPWARRTARWRPRSGTSASSSSGPAARPRPRRPSAGRSGSSGPGFPRDTHDWPKVSRRSASC